MSIRILQIMNRVPWPLKDGGALGFYTYTKGYYEAGCEVTVCAINTLKHHVDMHHLPDELSRIADWKSITLNTHVHPWKAFKNLFGSGSYNIERFQSARFGQLLSETLKQKQFDVIIFEGLFVTPYLQIVRKHAGKALCILREHNVEYRIWETLARNERNPLKRIYLNLLARRMKRAEMEAILRFDALTTVTQQDADHFKNMGCQKPVFVSPFGTDLSRLVADHSQTEQGSVFHLGSMEWLPNRQAMEWFLKKVWPEVTEQVPQAVFYLAGRNMPDSFLQFTSPHVKIVGEVEDAVRFMKGKSIMVVPLFAGSGIRVKILEGMALGKAIVSTTLGAQGIEAEDGNHLLLANDAKTFADALIRLLTQDQLREKLSLAAETLAKDKYDNTKIIRRVLQFYQTIIQTT